MHVNVTAATLISVEGRTGVCRYSTNDGQNDTDGRRSAIVSYIVYMEFYGMHWTVMVQNADPRLLIVMGSPRWQDLGMAGQGGARTAGLKL
jgi:hypothetical protein